jgi:gluconate 2-dehydrogenase gamma chain
MPEHEQMNLEENRSRMSRGRFLRGAGVAAAAVGVGGLAGCGTESEALVPLSENVDATQFPPLPPSQIPALCNVFRFFSVEEARAVEAFTARIVPGSPEDPGAREACVVSYVDGKLAGFRDFATKTYFRPPFAKPVKNGSPGPQPGAKDTILVSAAELSRYGFQSDQTPQQTYRAGLKMLDAFTRARFGRPFVALTEDEQDLVLGALETANPNPPSVVRKAKDMGDPKKALAAAAKQKKADLATPEQKLLAGIFTGPSAYGFFSTLKGDTYEGMFADPIYGGNRDLAGWKLIDYPGAQRAWTPYELRHGANRKPQGLLQMHPMNPGRPDDHAIHPISGSERTVP